MYDATGALVKRIDYDSFGNILVDTNPAFFLPFGFAGGLDDRDLGLVHFGFRDYDPSTGRWTAKDPIGFNGGDVDLYGYVLNDPVNLVDPEGEAGILIALPWVIPAIEGAINVGGGLYLWYLYKKNGLNQDAWHPPLRPANDVPYQGPSGPEDPDPGNKSNLPWWMITPFVVGGTLEFVCELNPQMPFCRNPQYQDEDANSPFCPLNDGKTPEQPQRPQVPAPPYMDRA